MNYEEFKKYVDEMNKNIFNKLKDNEEELAFYTELVKRFNDICKENQELKKHLKVPKACNLKTLEDYKSYYEDTTREQILEDTYIEYCAYVNLAHRYSKLKKQLEEYEIQNFNLREDIMIKKIAFPNDKIKDKTFYNLYDMPSYEDLLNQQQEFIKYLENEIKACKAVSDLLFNSNKEIKVYKEILQKYKEIIGGTNNTK